MTEFNWGALGRWEAKKEWQAEPHEEDCRCRYCSMNEFDDLDQDYDIQEEN